ncbi:ATP-binding cassette domain-containing protein [Candidatus Bathyarchaeota archaeon]|nr:ATP-binding cassette domain-containing protein [Candidatus Bathyarchaeota archaeon]
MEYAIETFNLTKRFNNFLAVDHVNLTVGKGELFGLLGPNGAGKTTLFRMLCTLLRPSEGTAKVAGFDIAKESNKIRNFIGIVTEKVILYPMLTPVENLMFFGRLYGLNGVELKTRVNELLEMVQLAEYGNKLVGTFSSGMRQRLSIIRGILHDPQIVFLDEPTVGLDPQSARFIRDLIIELNRQGKTIILTTHIMEEADQLSHRVGIMDHGRIIAVDKPQNLKQSLNAQTLEDVFLKLTGKGLRDSVESHVPLSALRGRWR